MSTHLIAQEIYLLERYSSPAYYKQMRDIFKTMVDTGYAALDKFIEDLPRDYRDYRARPLYQQPDIVWGERVLPNLSYTAAGLDKGYELLLSGDWRALGEIGIGSDFIAIGRDYSNDWMPEPFRSKFDEGYASWCFAFNISHTAQNGWIMGSLGRGYDPEARGPLDPPKTWPIYRLNPAVTVYTGEPVPRNGIYLPAVDESHPQVLIKGEGYKAWEAYVGLNELELQYRERVATLWTLVERVADEGGEAPGKESWRAPEPQHHNQDNRCEGGNPCPKEGWWWTPAARNNDAGRRYFKKGEIMPNFKSDYGMVIWQWSGPADEGKAS